MSSAISRKLTKIGILVAAGVLLVACGAGSPAAGAITSAEDLIGTYRGGSVGDSWIRFVDDGTYEIAFGGWPTVLNNPNIEGSYRFEDGKLLMVDTSNNLSAECNGVEGQYEVIRSAEGRLEFALVGDACASRSTDLTGDADGWSSVPVE